jgi:hypothetical protein
MGRQVESMSFGVCTGCRLVSREQPAPYKKAFEPLLVRAVEESVLLIFSPYDFYTHLSEHANGEITVENLKRILKYVKVNRNLLENLITSMGKQKLDKVDEETYAALLNNVFQNIQASPDDIGVYFDNFSKIETLKEGDIYGVSKEVKLEEGPAITKVEPSEVAHAPETELKESESKEEVKTLNEKHSKSAPTLGDMLESKKIDSIKTHLSINQKFMFNKVLFDDNQEEFEKALEVLDNCETKEAAMRHIYATYPHWNVESEEFEEFVELLEKRLD